MEKHPQALRLCALICITFSSLLHIVEPQDQKGFISLDCGSPPNEPPYSDVQTGLTFSTDNGFVETGKTGKVQKEIESVFPKPVWNLRYFPDGIRNCYTLDVTQGTKYLIRALFVYGNYDGLNEYPSFDLYLGPNILETIDLIKTGISYPMINTLELRPLQNNSTYNTQSGSLRHFRRNYFSTASRTVRYQSSCMLL
ncbi:PREDICTED: receptor-like protein kinase At3g21340 [Brassica oleracea var. oleracea]|uniref:receptor-like protein kinase At3g21340 n=1 Tax=Brassica oleracea var. oleracea TaxID=109376 RepID=UPI0006A6D45A|nr:PREDICTED: receptor-like protein kinase At3g21340 [Brassica oleracea var. oleracea]